MQLFLRLAAIAGIAPLLTLAAPFKRSDNVVPGKYIVRLRPDVDVASVTSHIASVKELHARNALGRRDLSYASMSGVEKEYAIGDFHGYAGGFDEVTLEEMRNMPEVPSPPPNHHLSNVRFVD